MWRGLRVLCRQSSQLAAANMTAGRITSVGRASIILDNRAHATPLAVCLNVPLTLKGISSFAELTADALTVFQIANPPVEILVIGSGERTEMLPPPIRAHLKKFNINVEVQDTRHAISSYNFLMDEGRRAAGLFFGAGAPSANDTQSVRLRSTRSIDEVQGKQQLRVASFDGTKTD
eukprot:m.66031 g.66031  ORF g.66031 m.66031 type:complete len:176 (+) comp49841_c0_seq2:752-1279(+)